MQHEKNIRDIINSLCFIWETKIEYNMKTQTNKTLIYSHITLLYYIVNIDSRLLRHDTFVHSMAFCGEIYRFKFIVVYLIYHLCF